VNPSLDRDAEQYVHTVLSLYQQLPETPALPSSRDRLQAHQLQQRRLPLTLIETALLLGSLRRLLRAPDAPALSPIHSLAYFGPVIEELLHNPVPDTYIEYLRRKMQPFAGKKVTAKEFHPARVQKNANSDDR
jgi:hypothetical protein